MTSLHIVHCPIHLLEELCAQGVGKHNRVDSSLLRDTYANFEVALDPERWRAILETSTRDFRTSSRA